MGAFDVYVIHCHILVFDIIMNNHFKWILDMKIFLIPIITVCLSVIIYVILAIMGIFRSMLFEKVHLDYVLRKIATKIDTVVYSAIKLE